MFFLFAGGLEHQAGRVLKKAAGRCIRCGGMVDLVDHDKVLKLFFVPIWRWTDKQPAFYCRNCSFISIDSVQIHGDASSNQIAGIDLRCKFCTRPVDPQFRFCPFCGLAL